MLSVVSARSRARSPKALSSSTSRNRTVRIARAFDRRELLSEGPDSLDGTIITTMGDDCVE